MPDLLLELRSEEIPARMQRKAAGDLREMVTDGLVESGLTYEGAREYWTPRRLVLDIRGVTVRSKDVREERKGPRTDAPEKAIEGFLRSAGLSSVDEAEIQSDPKKGDFYVAIVSKPGRGAEEIVAAMMPGIIRDFPWPKSMRWGTASAKPGALRWVRPLQSIVCTFGPETEEPVVVDFEVGGVRSGNVTYGHRFHAPEPITVRRFDDYVAKLEAARVVLDAERRKHMILHDARNLAFAAGLELVEDEGLLEEVSGLVEWPVMLMGEFEAEYLAIPPEVVRLTIRANQKCFVTRPVDQEENLSNRFVITANIEAKDGGKEIAYGNGKVVRARLSDALYFWNTDQADLPDIDQLKASAEKFDLDLKKPLDQRMARLDHLGVTFHAKLGTQGERVERIAQLAEELAPLVGADPALARRAAVLVKADLTTEIVGEFPELQGAMGRKYALLQGEHASVAAAIEEHYRPHGPSDVVPTDPVAIAVALADKLDTLVGFWAINEKPTGSKDPYALRRAALGVIRILVENGFAVSVSHVTRRAYWQLLLREARRLRIVDSVMEVVPLLNRITDWGSLYRNTVVADQFENEFHFDTQKRDFNEKFFRRRPFVVSWVLGEQAFDEVPEIAIESRRLEGKILSDLLSFFHDRLKIYLRDKGARHDLIDAVLAGGAGPSSPAGPSPRQDGEKEDGRDADASLAPSLRGKGERRSQNDDLVLIVRRVEALSSFLDTEDGKNLLAGTKRAANILGIEEKKGTRVAGTVDPALLAEKSEIALYAAVNQAEKEAGQAIQEQDFSGAMRALAKLRAPVDSFFEDVLVNDEDEAVRANRLALLARIRAATGQVADFSKIAG